MTTQDGEEMKGMIRVDRVSKRYADGTLALDAIDLEIAPGDFVSLIGPSGCGKSTLMRLIAGLSAPTTGHIQSPALDHSQVVSVVFQDATLMPWASIAENVALAFQLGAAQAPKDLGAHVEAALARVGLSGFGGRFPRQLSGGMRMRASLARALVTDPCLVLMDEPFGALDEITRNELNDDLLALYRARRMTVVFVTHSVSEAVYLSNRIVVMSPRPGRIHEIIPVPEAQPREPAFRVSPSFFDLTAKVSASLKATVENEALS